MPVNGLSGSPIPILKQYDGELYTWIATQVWTCHSNDVTENDEYTEKPGDSPYLEITLCCLFLS